MASKLASQKLSFSLNSFLPASREVHACRQCTRTFWTSSARRAGHNKWSKVKHIKAKTDARKVKARDHHSTLIATATRLFGANVQFNPQLANAISAAKAASVPSRVIDNAIARGQGKSPTGAALELYSLEILVPPNIALIVDAETDNKTRTSHDLRHTVKNCDGVVGSTQFFFTRRGRTVYRAKGGRGVLTLSQLLDEAIEHEGSEDVEEIPDGGGYILWTEPSSLMAVSKALSSKFDLEVLESDIVWAANKDTLVDVDSSESVELLGNLLRQLRDHSEVNAIYANVRKGEITAAEWEGVEKYINL